MLINIMTLTAEAVLLLILPPTDLFEYLSHHLIIDHVLYVMAAGLRGSVGEQLGYNYFSTWPW